MLAPGTKLGSYEIADALGAGGMGEVYRATDTQLGREVAVKVLPRAFAADPDRLARFEREARVLASLNHPHIAAIYGVEAMDGGRALILELVEGPTLAEKLRRGALPLGEALAIARADRRGARGRAREGHRASRPQARQHQGDAGRHGQGAGLRAREDARRRGDRPQTCPR